MISAKRSRFIIVYADDFLLISSSVTDLEKLIQRSTVTDLVVYALDHVVVQRVLVLPLSMDQ